MDTITKDLLNEVFQLFKNHNINLISNYKNEIARHLVRKLEWGRLLKKLKSNNEITQNVFDREMEATKLFDEMFENRIEVISKAKKTAILQSIGNILEKYIEML